MRGFVILLLVSICSSALGITYYVAPNGLDGSYPNRGTYSKPWATFQYAFDNVSAGDTVFFRGGIYYATSDGVSKSYLSGTAGDPICFFNYPDEEPILDGSLLKSERNGIYLFQCNYIHIKGITVRNFRQIVGPALTSGIYANFCTNITIEKCVSHDIGGRCFWIRGSDQVYLHNCDAFNVVDSLSLTPGNAGDCYIVNSATHTTADTASSVVFRGCRAWNSSDDGWDVHSEGYIELDSCWAINCGGYKVGAYGNGFKIGLGATIQVPKYGLARKITNCVAINALGSGLTTNDNDAPYVRKMNIYNNSFAFCKGPGVTILNTLQSESDERVRTFKNNLSYANLTPTQGFNGGIGKTDEYNSWNLSTEITVNEADFVSLDELQLFGQRTRNGSLPEINCLTLKDSSDLKDAGTNVGLLHLGTPQYIGAFGVSNQNTSTIYVNSISVSGLGGSESISTNRGTLQFVASVYPEEATNKSLTWSVKNGTGQATISQSGLVTAVSNGIVTILATAKDGSGVVGSKTLTISNQNIFVTAITVVSTTGSTVINTDHGQLQLSAIVLPSDATNQSINWSIIEGTGQASISSTGVVTALGNGTVTAKALSIDGSGSYGTLAITIAYSVSPMNLPPSVTISSPSKSNTFIAPATIILEAVASDPEGLLTKVEFYQENIKIGETYTSPFSMTWKDVQAGRYAITAIAIDNLSQKTVSGVVNILVEESSSTINQLPVVQIVSPNNEKKIYNREKTVIKIEATDPDGVISKVELKDGEITIAELFSAPFTCVWEPSHTGMYKIMAVATDNMGASSHSNELILNVEELMTDDVQLISIYPNPNTGNFNLSLNNPIPGQNNKVLIFSQAGQLVYQIPITEFEKNKEINLSDSPSGVYVLIIKSDSSILDSKKIIKQ